MKKRKPMKLPNVSSRYGAPMGRGNNIPSDATEREAPIKLRMVRLRWVDGDYDQGGAYWGNGSGTSIYWATNEPDGTKLNEETVDVFVRAATRAEAKELVRESLPAASFYN